MKDTEPLVSVIVPTKNSESTIEKCLTSIVGQSYSSIEVIVVDNFSKDDTVKIAQKFGAKVFLKGPERSAQVNFGVAKASGKYVYRVDSDFVLQPNVVKEAVEACEKHGFDAVAIHNTSDPRISFWAKVRKLERDCYKKDKLNSAARFWRKEVFVSIGGFDVKLMAGEDYDLQNSLTKRGYKVGWIEAEEVHIGEPKTLWEIIQKHYYYGKNLAFFIKKNREKAFLQLSPVKLSYFKAFRQIRKEPSLLAGFAVYQLARYASTFAGVLAAKVSRL